MSGLVHDSSVCWSPLEQNALDHCNGLPPLQRSQVKDANTGKVVEAVARCHQDTVDPDRGQEVHDLPDAGDVVKDK